MALERDDLVVVHAAWDEEPLSLELQVIHLVVVFFFELSNSHSILCARICNMFFCVYIYIWVRCVISRAPLSSCIYSNRISFCCEIQLLLV